MMTKSCMGRTDGDDAPLTRKTALAMGVPRNGTVSRVWAQTDPLVTGRAEDAEGLKLGYVRVGTKVVDTLFFGTFCPSALGWWLGRAHLDGWARGTRDRGADMRLERVRGWRSGGRGWAGEGEG